MKPFKNLRDILVVGLILTPLSLNAMEDEELHFKQRLGCILDDVVFVSTPYIESLSPRAGANEEALAERRMIEKLKLRIQRSEKVVAGIGKVLGEHNAFLRDGDNR